MKATLSKIAIAILIALACAGGITAIILRNQPGPEPPRPHITGVLELGSIADSTAALVTGYNYHLLKKYAEDSGKSISIELARREESYLDSLKAGKVDIVVVPFSDSLVIDSVLVSLPLDSLSVWLTHHEDGRWMESLNGWIAAWHQSDDFESTKELFLKNYNPYKNAGRGYISPYDSLMRSHADSIKTDWRLMAAIMYTESRFHIEAHSHRGATGLMQVMPYTAHSMGINDLLDPEENVRAGALLINKLSRHFHKEAANQEELRKFILASYNAGMGRIDDCINYAKLRDKDSGYWDNIVEIIPEMSDSELVASNVLAHGRFLGQETINYVESVTNIYQEFCKIYPE